MVGYRKQFEARIGITLEELKNKIEELILENKPTSYISKQLKISSPLVKKYAPKECLDILKTSNKINQIVSSYQYKNGQVGLYGKIRRQLIKELHPCIICGTTKKVRIHHKNKIDYTISSANYKTTDFINTLDKIEFLCTSCHQRKHYREYNRTKVSHCKICGQFSDKTLLCKKCGGNEYDKK